MGVEQASIAIALRCHRVAFLFRMSLQEDAVVDAGWELFLIVGNHDHRLVLSLAECLDDILYQAAVSVVKTMKRLVEDEKLRILHEGTCQKYQALLAT